MARPRKLMDASSGNYTKEQIEDKRSIENALYEYEALDPNATPTGITKEGWLIYNELAPKMKQLPVSCLDEGMLVMYCNTFAIYQEVVREVSENGAVGKDGKTTGAFKAMMETQKQLKSIASSLGLTLDARMRMIIPDSKKPEKEPDDLFGKMMKGVDQ